jgi:hypothetical protein
MAIGWLAREDKLEITKAKTSLKVALKASELRYVIKTTRKIYFPQMISSIHYR